MVLEPSILGRGLDSKALRILAHLVRWCLGCIITFFSVVFRFHDTHSQFRFSPVFIGRVCCSTKKSPGTRDRVFHPVSRLGFESKVSSLEVARFEDWSSRCGRKSRLQVWGKCAVGKRVHFWAPKKTGKTINGRNGLTEVISLLLLLGVISFHL